MEATFPHSARPADYMGIPKDKTLWKEANARYHRSDKGGGRWEVSQKHPESWDIGYKGLRFKISPTGFKHTGLFPEQAVNWDQFIEWIPKAGRPISVLNLFAYTGGATLALNSKQALSVCHVDASKGMVQWAKENAQLSGLSDKPVRWIVDDCEKFVQRELRRGRRYDAIIMDPPSYGRGPSGEVWQLEEKSRAFGPSARGFSPKIRCSWPSIPTPPGFRRRSWPICWA